MTEPRIVVITGAASGIGYATAELFRDLGDTVYGLDIQPTVPDGVTYVECNVGGGICRVQPRTPDIREGGYVHCNGSRR